MIVTIVNIDSGYDVFLGVIRRLTKEPMDDYRNLNFLNTSNVTHMVNAFIGSQFDGDISEWDVSSVEDMCSMFRNSKFNGDISNWQVENVVYMNWMFAHSRFDKDISGWNVRKVAPPVRMFKNSPLENKPEFQPQFYK